MSDRKEIPEVAHLRRMRRRIVKGWCQEVYAKDEQGNEVDYSDKKACSWCLSGAAFATRKGRGYNDTLEMFKRANAIGYVPGYNDRVKSQAEVLAALDKAIRYARRVRVARPAA